MIIASCSTGNKKVEESFTFYGHGDTGLLNKLSKAWSEGVVIPWDTLAEVDYTKLLPAPPVPGIDTTVKYDPKYTFLLDTTVGYAPLTIYTDKIIKPSCDPIKWEFLPLPYTYSFFDSAYYKSDGRLTIKYPVSKDTLKWELLGTADSSYRFFDSIYKVKDTLK